MSCHGEGTTEASTTNYFTMIYNPPSCGCAAHRQHQLLRYRYFHPSASLREAAGSLKVSYGYARLLWTRLRRRKDFGRLCPLCFSAGLAAGVCHACGFEPGQEPVIDDPADEGRTPEAGRTYTAKATDPQKGWSSPVHRILPDHGLGSSLSARNIATLARGTMYTGEKVDQALLRKHAAILSHLIEPEDENLVKGIRSMVLEELKSTYPEAWVTDAAARLISEEVKAFRSAYPNLSRPKGLKEQLAANVMKRLELLRPAPRNSATPVLEARP